jgi:hypothetical protein
MEGRPHAHFHNLEYFADRQLCGDESLTPPARLSCRAVFSLTWRAVMPFTLLT